MSNYRDDFIAAERNAAEKRALDALEGVECVYSQYHGTKEGELLILLLTTPNDIIQHALGFNLRVNIPERTKDSDNFENYLFFGETNNFDLLTSLNWNSRLISYEICDDGDPGVGYYKEVVPKKRSVRFDHKMIYCDPDDLDAIPIITSTAESWWNLSKKKTRYDIQAYIDCINYWREQERQNVVLMFRFDVDEDLLVDGQDFGWHMAHRFETSDVVFGKQFVADLKAKYGE